MEYSLPVLPPLPILPSCSAPVTCPKGNYCPTGGLVAPIPCKINYYQNSTGQTSCLPCPAGKTTRGVRGATSANACKSPTVPSLRRRAAF